MLRTMIVSLAAIAVSGCNVGLPSAVDVAPFEVRTPAPAFTEGVYCAFREGQDGVVRVATGEDDICSGFAWDSEARLYRADNGDRGRQAIAVVDLGGGLLLSQISSGEKEQQDSAFSNTLMAFSVHDSAMALIPVINDERVRTFAADYPGIVLDSYAEGHGNPDGPPPIHHYVAEGEPEDIRALVRDIALRSISEMILSLDEGAAEPTGLIPFAVRDARGAPDHLPTAEQQRDIDVLVAKLRALAK